MHVPKWLIPYSAISLILQEKDSGAPTSCPKTTLSTPSPRRSFKRYPGKRETLALTAHGSIGVPSPDLRLVRHLTATALGLDPMRLVPHSLRVDAQAQIEMHSNERRLQQGGWNTMEGMKVCARKR